MSEDLQDGAVLAGVTVRSPFKLAVHEAPLPGPAATGGVPVTGRKKSRR
jgi:hypothetical protein